MHVRRGAQDKVFVIVRVWLSVHMEEGLTKKDIP